MKLLWLAVVCTACSGAPPALPANATPTARAPAPRSTACDDARAFHRETLLLGTKTEIAYGGLTGTYRGSQHDQFDDGTTAMLLDLELFGESWLPDVRDRATHAVGEHCVRIISSDAQQVVLEVALQPAHEYDPSRCQMSCCASDREAMAPDGTRECCFCSDAPR